MIPDHSRGNVDPQVTGSSPVGHPTPRTDDSATSRLTVPVDDSREPEIGYRRVAISGSRGPDPSRGRMTGWTDLVLVERIMRRILERGDRINVGDAPSGVDRMVAEVWNGADWTEAYPSDYVKTYEARWEIEGRRAGHNRNAWMISESDELIALFAPGPLTPGTTNAVECAERKGIPVRIYHEGRWEIST